ncbi:MAG: hypothetical protein K6F32_04450 [Bacilli bacterium]|nr:hypothetical protein [Bacilli bacterium]
MKPREFNSLLLQRFPEIKEDFESYVGWQDGIDTGSFLVVEDVFNKTLWQSLEGGDIALAKRIFSFAEAILNQGDDYACNVIIVGFLEAIKGDERAAQAIPYLLPRSKAEYDSITL